MAATIAHDFDLPLDRVAAGARVAIGQLGYRYSEMRAGTSTRTIDFDIPGAVPSRYVLEIRQIVPNASRVFVTGNIPQLCQETLDYIQTTLNE
jgi:hypothetical protein